MLKKLKNILLILTGTLLMNSADAQIKVGVFADCQYCDCEPAINRYYRNSLSKLRECISVFNGDKEIDFVVGLGDLIDRDFSSFDSVNPVLESSHKKVFHVCGNHDFEVENRYFESVPEKLNLKSTYYTFHRKNWQFIFLDGNEITLNSNDSTIVTQAKMWIEKLTSENQPNNKTWNGGISVRQQGWLLAQLEKAVKKKRNVAIFCHYPVYPTDAHALWNSREILGIIEKYDCVKAWINGHNHAGNYAEEKGIHFINLRGMVDTETENAFSVFSFGNEKIEIKGFGREKSRIFTIK